MVKKGNGQDDSNANAKALHSFLVDKKVAGIPVDEEAFVATLDMKDNARKVHNTLLQMNVRNVPENYKSFRSKLNLPTVSVDPPKAKKQKESGGVEVVKQSDSWLKKKYRELKTEDRADIDAYKDELRKKDAEEIKEILKGTKTDIKEKVEKVDDKLAGVESIPLIGSAVKGIMKNTSLFVEDLLSRKDRETLSSKQAAEYSVYKEKTLVDYYGDIEEREDTDYYNIIKDYVGYLSEHEPESAYNQKITFLLGKGKNLKLQEREELLNQAVKHRLAYEAIAYKKTLNPEVIGKTNDLLKLSDRQKLLKSNIDSAQKKLTGVEQWDDVEKEPDAIDIKNVYPEDLENYYEKVNAWIDEYNDIIEQKKEINKDPGIIAHAKANDNYTKNANDANKLMEEFYAGNKEFKETDIGKAYELHKKTLGFSSKLADPIMSSFSDAMIGIMTMPRYITGEEYKGVDRFADVMSESFSTIANDMFGKQSGGSTVESLVPFKTKMGDDNTELNLVAVVDIDGNATDIRSPSVADIPDNVKEEALSRFNKMEDKPIGVSSVNPQSIGYDATRTITDMALLLYGAEKFSQGFKWAGMGTKIARTIGLTASGMIFEHNTMYQEAVNSGMTLKQANKFALKTSAFVGALENISPQRAVFGRQVRKHLVKEYAKTLASSGEKAAFGKIAKYVGIEILEENIQEFSQTFAQKASEFGAYRKYGIEEMMPEVSLNELYETAILTTIATGGMSITSSSNLSTNSSDMKVDALYRITTSTNSKIVKALTDLRVDGILTAQQVSDTKDLINIAREVKKNIPENVFSARKEAILMQFLVDKEILKKRMNDADEVFKPEIEASIEEINSKIKKVTGKSTVPLEKRAVKNTELDEAIPKESAETTETGTDTETKQTTEKGESQSQEPGTTEKAKKDIEKRRKEERSSVFTDDEVKRTLARKREADAEYGELHDKLNKAKTDSELDELHKETREIDSRFMDEIKEENKNKKRVTNEDINKLNEKYDTELSNLNKQSKNEAAPEGEKLTKKQKADEKQKKIQEQMDKAKEGYVSEDVSGPEINPLASEKVVSDSQALKSLRDNQFFESETDEDLNSAIPKIKKSTDEFINGSLSSEEYLRRQGINTSNMSPDQMDNMSLSLAETFYDNVRAPKTAEKGVTKSVKGKIAKDLNLEFNGVQEVEEGKNLDAYSIKEEGPAQGATFNVAEGSTQEVVEKEKQKVVESFKPKKKVTKKDKPKTEKKTPAKKESARKTPEIDKEFEKKSTAEKQKSLVESVKKSGPAKGDVIKDPTEKTNNYFFVTRGGKKLRMTGARVKRIIKGYRYEVKLLKPTKLGDKLKTADGTEATVIDMGGGVLGFDINGKKYGIVAQVFRINSSGVNPFVGNIAVNELTPKTTETQKEKKEKIKKTPEELKQEAEEHMSNMFRMISGQSNLLPGMEKYSSSSVMNEALKQLRYAAIKYVDAGIRSISLLRQSLRTDVLKSDLDKKSKDSLFDMIDNHIAMFEKIISDEALLMEFPDTVFGGAEDKLNTIRKSLRTVFDSLRKKEIKDPEKLIYNIAHEEGFDVKNREDFIQWKKNIAEKYGNDGQKMIDVFSEENIGLNSMISIMNLYSSMKVYRHVFLNFDGDGFKISDMNNKTDIENIVKKIRKKLSKYQYKRDDGKTIKNNNNALGESFKDYEKKRMNAAKDSEKFEADLDFISDITGIDKEIWRSYFVPETNETVVFIKQDNGDYVRKEFKNPQELFDSNDGYFPDNSYYKTASGQFKVMNKFNIVGSLIAEFKRTKEKSKLSRNMINFFTEREGKNTWTNAAKLASLQSAEYSFDYINPEGKRGVALVQSSNLSRSAETARDQKIKGNRVIDYYTALGKDMEIVYIAGARNMKTKNGLKSGKLNVRDMMTAQFLLFFNSEKDANGKEVYLQDVGQFGDKKQFATAKVLKREFNAEAEKWIKENIGMKRFNEIVDAHDDALFADNDAPNLFQKEGLRDRPGQINAIKGMVYNYLANRKDLNEIFFGEDSNYKGKGSPITNMYKRASSTNSSGYTLNESIENGVGERKNKDGKAVFRHIAINEKEMETEMGVTPGEKVKLLELFDGLSLMSDKFADRVKISMGALFSKSDIYNKLMTLKAVYSSTFNNRRGLTKSNIVNSGVLAKSLKGTNLYHKLNKFIEDNDIDMLSFESGTKIYEHRDQAGDPLYADLMKKEDNNLNNIEDVEKYTNERLIADLFVQQDLRNETIPKFAKQPIQYISSTLKLSNADRIAGRWTDIQSRKLKTFMNKYRSLKTDQEKRDWLKENIIDIESNRDLYLAIDKGASLNNPITARKIQTAMLSHINNNVLERKIRRVSTQEVPAADMELQHHEVLEIYNIKKEKNEKKVILPHVLVDIEGVRYAESFAGYSQIEKLLLTRRGQLKYPDMFDEEGNIKLWEIYEEDGKTWIPGEPIVVTRVPSDNLHSHQIMRAKYRIKGAGNVIITDRASQAISGSDNDGDKRYLEVVNKDSDGFPRLGDRSVSTMLNQNIYDVMNDFQDPANANAILEPIDTDAYNDIHSRLTKGKKAYETMSPDGRFDSYNKNIVGNKLKGILTNNSTVFSFMSKYGISLKRAKTIEINGKKRHFSRVNPDRDNLIKAHIGNLLNMAYDNGKDPKLEEMYINEETANVVVGLLITDDQLYDLSFDKDLTDSQRLKKQNDMILELIEGISKYIRDNGGVEYTEFKRNQNLISKESKGSAFKYAKKILESDSSTNEEKAYAEKLKSFAGYANTFDDLQRIKNFHALTVNAPISSGAMFQALASISSIIESRLTGFSTQGFFEEPDDSGLVEPKEEFKMALKTINAAMHSAFENSPELSDNGMLVFARLQRILEDGDVKLEIKHFEEFASLLNRYIVSKSIGVKKKITTLEKQLSKYISENEDDNAFLDMIQSDNDGSIGINNSLRLASISETDIEQAREDFANLPEEKRMEFAYYTLTKYGLADIRMAGSFQELIDLDTMTELMNRSGKEVERWTKGDVSFGELNSVAFTIANVSNEFSKVLPEKMRKDSRSSLRTIDPNIIPTEKGNISQEDLESVAHVTDPRGVDVSDDQISEELRFYINEWDAERSKKPNYKWSDYINDKILSINKTLNNSFSNKVGNIVSKIRALKTTSWMNPDILQGNLAAPIVALVDGTLETMATLIEKSAGTVLTIENAFSQAKDKITNSKAYRKLSVHDRYLYDIELNNKYNDVYGMIKHDVNIMEFITPEERAAVIARGGNPIQVAQENYFVSYLEGKFGKKIKDVRLEELASITNRGQFGLDDYILNQYSKDYTFEQVKSMSLVDKIFLRYVFHLPNRTGNIKEMAEKSELNPNIFENMTYLPDSPQVFSKNNDLDVENEIFTDRYKQYVLAFKKAMEYFDEFQSYGEIRHDEKKIKKVRTIANALAALDIGGSSYPIVRYLDDILLESRFHELLVRENKPGYTGVRNITSIIATIGMRGPNSTLLTADFKTNTLTAKIAKYIQHRKDFNYAEPLLQAYARDFYEYTNQSLVETLKMKSALKQFKEEIGDNIENLIDRSQTFSPVFMHPKSKDKDGNIRFPEGTMEREFLDMIYRVNYSGNPVFAARAMLDPMAEIPVPGEYMTRREAMKRFSAVGPRYSSKIYKHFKPSEYDNIIIDKQGETLSKIKNRIMQFENFSNYSTKDPKKIKALKVHIANGVSQLKTAKTKAKKYYKNQHDALENPLFKEKNEEPKSIATRGKSKIPEILRDSDMWGTLDDNLSSLISSKYKQKMLTMAKWVKYMYEQTKKTQTKAYEFLTVDIFNKIYGKNMDKDIKGFYKYANVIIDLAALRWLGLNLEGAIFNLTAGVLSNMWMAPKAFRTGMLRTLMPVYESLENEEEKKKLIQGKIKKLNNILKSIGLATVVEEAVGTGHRAKEKQRRKKAFVLIEIVESINQGVLVAGMMTKQEWESFDDDGNPRKDKDGNVLVEISSERKQQFKIKSQNIHGAYGVDKPAYDTILLGRLMGMLRFPWMYRAFVNQFGGESTDFTGQYTTGWMQGAAKHIAVKRYNTLSAERRKVVARNIKKGMPIAKALFNEKETKYWSIMDSFEKRNVIADIISSAEGEKINVDQLPLDMQKSWQRGMRYIGLITLLLVGLNLSEDEEEEMLENIVGLEDLPKEERAKLIAVKMAKSFFRRAVKDLALPFDTQGNLSNIGNPIVPYQYGVSLANLGIDITRMLSFSEEKRAKAKYDRSTEDAAKGELKIWNDILAVLPGIGAPLTSARIAYRRFTGQVLKEQEEQAIQYVIRDKVVRIALQKALNEGWPLDEEFWGDKYDDIYKEYEEEIINSVTANEILKSLRSIVADRKKGITSTHLILQDFARKSYDDDISGKIFEKLKDDYPESMDLINRNQDAANKESQRLYNSREAAEEEYKKQTEILIKGQEEGKK